MKTEGGLLPLARILPFEIPSDSRALSLFCNQTLGHALSDVGAVLQQVKSPGRQTDKQTKTKPDVGAVLQQVKSPGRQTNKQRQSHTELL